MKYQNYGKKTTPQTEPLANQVKNNAGGYVYQIDPLQQLKRWLIIGSTANTYYTGKRKLTRDNLDVLDRLLISGRGKEAIDAIVEISISGRAPNEDTALFALARCCACDVHGVVSATFAAKKNTIRDPKLVKGLVHKYALAEATPKVVGHTTYTLQGATVLKDRAERTDRVQLDPRDIEIRQYAYSQLTKVARMGTHWMHFLNFVEQFRGWGATQKRGAQFWYDDKSVKQVAYQAVKYQSRDKWSHRDALRLAHPKANGERAELYKWITKHEIDSAVVANTDPLLLVRAYEQVKQATTTNEAVDLIRAYSIPGRAIPTEHQSKPEVWEALLDSMMPEELIRNLAHMTSIGTLAPFNAATQRAVAILHDQQALISKRVHPMKILIALRQYELGHSLKGHSRWTPLRPIIDALDDAFYLAFGAFTPADKRLMLALDISWSMGTSYVMGLDTFTARAASAAIALVTASRERDYMIMGFGTKFTPLTISPKQRLSEAERVIRGLDFEATDCAVPMIWAAKNNIPVDGFVIYTDNESFAGPVHVSVALERYRQKMGIDAKLVAVGMTATEYSVADPNDPASMDVVGFDVAAPDIINSFLRGEL